MAETTHVINRVRVMSCRVSDMYAVSRRLPPCFLTPTLTLTSTLTLTLILILLLTRRVKQLKTTEAGHAANHLIQTLRSYTDGKKKEQSVVEQGAEYWEKKAVVKDMSYWFNKLKAKERFS